MTDFWDYYWATWLLIGFGIPEAYTLYIAIKYKRHGGTLSENIRQWFATDVKGWSNKTVGAKLRRLFMCLGMVWLTLHWMVPNIF